MKRENILKKIFNIVDDEKLGWQLDINLPFAKKIEVSGYESVLIYNDKGEDIEEYLNEETLQQILDYITNEK